MRPTISYFIWVYINFCNFLQDQIGWRSKARRMLIYASDVDYHFAGDGKVPVYLAAEP
jgi:hypothetical protein